MGISKEVRECLELLAIGVALVFFIYMVFMYRKDGGQTFAEYWHGYLHGNKYAAKPGTSGFSGTRRQARASPATDYDSYVMNQGLEQTVYDSHRAFVADSLSNTTGASRDTVLSGDVDVVPWVGLRRPDYSVPVDVSALKAIPSQAEYQLPVGTKYSGPGGLY
jgi:hypothetical protein